MKQAGATIQSIRGHLHRWFPGLGTRPGAALRLFCFSYAGGTPSVYRDWGQQLAADVEIVPVLLPGRGLRMQEPPFTRIGPLVDALVMAIEPHVDGPFAFFGHSMGALVAFDVARALATRHGRTPLHLFASGCRPPPMHGRESTHALPSSRLIGIVRDLGSVPPELDDAALIRQRLPLLRADLSVCETYECEDGATVSCPITAYGGWSDPIVAPDDLDGWTDHTTASFVRRLLPGNHFFIQGPHREHLLRALDRELQMIVDRCSPYRAAAL